MLTKAFLIPAAIAFAVLFFLFNMSWLFAALVALVIAWAYRKWIAKPDTTAAAA